VFAASSLGMTINRLMTADIEEEVGVGISFGGGRPATAPFPSFRSTAEVGSLDGFILRQRWNTPKPTPKQVR
jgi:hypothetical protein